MAFAGNDEVRGAARAGLARHFRQFAALCSHYSIRDASEWSLTGRQAASRGTAPAGVARAEELERLSLIIKELNERFGTDFSDADRVTIQQLEEQLLANQALAASVRINTPDNARLTFDHVVTDQFQDLIDSNFRFYKQVTDDAEFSKALLDWLFERYRQRARRTPPQPSRTREGKG